MENKYMKHFGKKVIPFITAALMLCSLTQAGVFAQSDPEKM